MKPTVIRTSESDENESKPVRPTVIQAAGSPTAIEEVAPKRTSVKPTVISSGSAPPISHTTISPTEMPGTKHTRIPLTIEDLRAHSPQTKDGILEKALRCVFAFDPTDLSDTTIVLWGQPCQTKYNELVSKCLEYSELPVRETTSKHVSRLQEIIQGIHLKALFGLEKQGWADRIASLTASESPLDGFNRTRTEASQLVKLMQEDLPRLLVLKTDIESVSHKIDDLGDEVEANALAALFLADYTLRGASDKDRLKLEARADLFTQRSMSLTQTLAQIRGNSLMREMQIRQPLQLVAIVQNVILVTVPAWLATYSSLKSVLENHQKPTLTEIDELDRTRLEILNKLKKEA